MDLTEYAFCETQRTLKRLGVTHLWRESKPMDAGQDSPEPVDVATGLPSYLQVLFHGKQFPVPVMWTYIGLESDLAAATLPPRLALFKKIKKAACTLGGWKAADICVWPLAGPPEIFIAGFNFFQPRLILSFGPLPDLDHDSAALHDYLPKVQILPSLEPMLAGDQAAKDAAWSALKTLAAKLRS